MRRFYRAKVIDRRSGKERSHDFLLRGCYPDVILSPVNGTQSFMLDTAEGLVISYTFAVEAGNFVMP